MAVEIEELIVADEPAAWAAVGFAVDGDACELGGVRVRLAGRGAGRGLAGWKLRGAVSTELDGLGTSEVGGGSEGGGGGAGDDDAAPRPGGGAGDGDATPRTGDADATPRTGDADATASSHPNGVAGLDHVVAITPDLDRTTAALVAAGLDLRRVREEPTPAGAPRQAFFRLGTVILEVVQEPAEAIERGGGPERPAFFWGLALLAPDLDASLAQLGPELVSEAREAVQPGRRIATLRRTAGLALPVALISAQSSSR